MFKKDIEVEIPDSKVRIKKQNKNRYVYAVLGRAGDSKGNVKDVTREIGKITREGFMNPNDSYFRLYPEKDIHVIPFQPSSFDSQSKIGAMAALQSIAKKKGILDCLKLAFGEKNASLILSLASYYTIARDSAAMLYSDFMFDHYGTVTEIASESAISRLFNKEMDIGKVDAFRSAYLKHCFTEAVKKRDGERKEKARLFVDLDSTNINVSSESCTDAEYGKAKVDEGLPQINMAYFYDRSSGVPVFYDSFYGSITDITHCTVGIKAMMDNLNQDSKDVCYDFVLDRGYFSQKNMESLRNGNISFAVMGKSTTIFSDYIGKHHDEIRSSVSLISVGSYGIRLKGKAFAKDEGPDYNIYLYFDSTKETEEKSGIEQRLLDAKKALKGKKEDKTGGLRRTYGNYLKIETEGEDDEIKSVETNRESVDGMLSEAGYFWIVSTMEMEPDEMLRAYRERDEIEKSFRIVKSESDLNKTYAQNNAALNAKLMMGFLTAILRGELTAMTRKITETKTNLSTQKMLLALDKIIMYQVNGRYALKYAYTALQQEIMKALGVEKSEIESVIALWNSKEKADDSIKN